MKNQTQKVQKLALTALFAAICYVAFTYLKVPLPGGTALHVGNAFCVLCALMLGGVYGGLAGSIGMTIADLLDPVYITSAPKTFILKLCIGLITGLVAHKLAHITESHDQKYVFKWTILSSVAGLAFNVIFDPLVGYLYNLALGMDANAANILVKWSSAATFINAVASVIIVTILYMALRPVMKKAGFFMHCTF